MRSSSTAPHTTVTVIVTTYNDERYIAQAIESILAQDVDFECEIVIIDDCSTDRTRDILRGYHRLHSRTVRLVLEDHNRNDDTAWLRELLRAQSTYIALLDGDDYWTSPTKLQKQVEFLDTHPECVTCFHNMSCVYEDASKDLHNSNPQSQKTLSSLDDLWQGNFIPTSSTVVRRIAIAALPDWLATTALSDWAFHILTARYGGIGYLDEVLGVYRQHGSGVWNRLSRIPQAKQTLEFYHEINANLKFVYDEPIRSALMLCGRTLRRHIAADILAGHIQDALRGALVLLRYCPAALLPQLRSAPNPVEHSRYPVVPRLLSRCKYFLKSLYMFDRPASRYAGFVDIANSTTIAGWAWNLSRPTCPISVEILT